MATSPEYTEFVLDLLQPIEPGATPRKMFGGIGIFREGVMFALITSEDVLYLRVDDENRPDFAAAGMGQFHRMPYFQAPVDVLEDQAALASWVAKAVAASQRADALKKKKKKK